MADEQVTPKRGIHAWGGAAATEGINVVGPHRSNVSAPARRHGGTAITRTRSDPNPKHIDSVGTPDATASSGSASSSALMPPSMVAAVEAELETEPAAHSAAAERLLATVSSTVSEPDGTNSTPVRHVDETEQGEESQSESGTEEHEEEEAAAIAKAVQAARKPRLSQNNVEKGPMMPDLESLQKPVDLYTMLSSEPALVEPMPVTSSGKNIKLSPLLGGTAPVAPFPPSSPVPGRGSNDGTNRAHLPSRVPVRPPSSSSFVDAIEKQADTPPGTRLHRCRGRPTPRQRRCGWYCL